MTDQTTTTLDPITHDDMRQVIANAVSWLTAAQEPNGHFRYEYLPYFDIYSQDDNLVRQAGALYALGEVAKHDGRGAQKYELMLWIRRAIAYFESLSVESDYNGTRFRAVCDPNTRKCRLGTTCLALCGMLAAAERYPEIGVIYADLIQDYKNFIVAMKLDGAGFISTYAPSTKTQRLKESSYFNGEAMLALARYRRYADARGLLLQDDPSDRITKEMFSYIDSSAVPFDTALYLWAMAALNDVTAYDTERGAQHADYAKRYTLWRIDSVNHKKSSKHNFASAVEGFTSAYTLLQNFLPEAELQSIAKEIDFWLAHTARTQLNVNDRQHAQTRNASRANGGFLTGLLEPTQRIDFTQHALMSFVQKLADIDKQPL